MLQLIVIHLLFLLTSCWDKSEDIRNIQKMSLNERVNSLKSINSEYFISDLRDLNSFPNGNRWKLVFDLNEKKYFGSSRRMRVFPDELLIRHYLAIFDNSEWYIHFDKIHEIKDKDLLYYFNSNKALYICETETYKKIGLPIFSRDDVYKVYHIDYRLEKDILVEADYIILKNDIIIGYFRKYPIRQLSNKYAEGKAKAIEESDTFNYALEPFSGTPVTPVPEW